MTDPIPGCECREFPPERLPDARMLEILRQHIGDGFVSDEFLLRAGRALEAELAGNEKDGAKQ